MTTNETRKAIDDVLSKAWTVSDRHGWGFSVSAVDDALWPVESAILAQEIADGLNAGKSVRIAVEDAGGIFSDGRIVKKS